MTLSQYSQTIESFEELAKALDTENLKIIIVEETSYMQSIKVIIFYGFYSKVRTLNKFIF